MEIPAHLDKRRSGSIKLNDVAEGEWFYLNGTIAQLTGNVCNSGDLEIYDPNNWQIEDICPDTLVEPINVEIHIL